MRQVPTLQQDLMPNTMKGKNEEEIHLHLDLLYEVKAIAKQWMACYQDLMAKHYNTKVKPRHFNIGDLVLRKVTTAAKDPTQRKLGPNWEAPYIIIECNRKGIKSLSQWDGSITKDIDDQGCLRAPNPHPKLSPTYGMDQRLRMPTGT